MRVRERGEVVKERDEVGVGVRDGSDIESDDPVAAGQEGCDHRATDTAGSPCDQHGPGRGGDVVVSRAVV